MRSPWPLFANRSEEKGNALTQPDEEVLEQPVAIRSSSRPIKVAYLVPAEESPVSQLILDAIFYEACSRWAGLYTLVVRCTSTALLNSEDTRWLRFHDPDFVMSYVDVSESLIRDIDQQCCPVAFLKHGLAGSAEVPERGWRVFLPNWEDYFHPVSSQSTVQSPVVHTQRPFGLDAFEPEPTVITAWKSNDDRLFNDNFGAAFDIHMTTHAVSGLYKTLCLAPEDLPKHMHVGTERCSSLAMVFRALTKGALSIAMLARAHSDGVPKAESFAWSHAFHLFVGNGYLDRLCSWHARHLVPSHVNGIGTLRLPAHFFDDDDNVSGLGAYLNNHNFLGRGGGPYQCVLHSHSIPDEQLLKIQARLQPHTYNAISVSRTRDAPSLPNDSNLETWQFARSAAPSTTTKLAERSSTLLAEEPQHFIYVPPRFRGITRGQWMVDLDIQRHHNLSRYSNVVESWKLPRRRKIIAAFSRRLGKVTLHGRVALLPSTDNFLFDSSADRPRRYELTLPDDETFFRHCALNLFDYPGDDLRASIKRPGFKALQISDKGQHLRGVVSMFNGLSQAYSILTNAFWRAVLRSAKEDVAKPRVFDLNKLQSFLPSDRAAKDRLAGAMNVDIKQLPRTLGASLLDTLEYLVRARVFYQVLAWRCAYCGHTNSRSFDNMKIRNQCDICETEYFAPIDATWEFELNEFVHRSLIKNSGLPVLWTIGYLQDGYSRESFWFLPEVNLYRDPDNEQTRNEIDLLCVVDGRFGAAEVKTSVSLFVHKVDEVEKFIEVVNLLTPDIAILSFEKYSNATEDLAELREKLSQTAATIQSRIEHGTKLEVIVASDIVEFGEFPTSLGHFGSRSAALPW